MGTGLLTERTVVIMGRVSREQRSETDVWEWDRCMGMGMRVIRCHRELELVMDEVNRDVQH